MDDKESRKQRILAGQKSMVNEFMKDSVRAKVINQIVEQIKNEENVEN